MFCSYCGAKLNDDARFCSACGKPVVGTTEKGEDVVSKTEENPIPKVLEEKPTRKRQDNGLASKDQKLSEKLPLKALLGILCGLVVIVLAIVLISNAVDEKKRTTNLGSIPDPQAYFNLSADVDLDYEHKQNEYRFEYNSVTLEMAEAYAELLTSGKYPFVLSSVKDDTKTGTAEKKKFARTWKFDYDGAGEVWFDTDWEVYLRYYYSNYYGEYIEVLVRSPGNFELVSPGQNFAGETVAPESEQAEGGLVVVAAPDHYLSMDAELDDNTMRFTVENSPVEAVHDYVALLQSKYGMVLQESYEDEGCGEWILCAAENSEASFCICIDRAGNGTWDVVCDFSAYVFTADVEVWGASGERPVVEDTPVAEQTKPAQPETVAGIISVNNNIQAPENAVPELSAWSNGAAESDRVVTRSETTVKYDVPSSVVKEYVEALQDHGFTLVDEHYFSYKGKTFQSWGITCDAVPGADTITMQYEDTPCHITIWMADDDSEYTVSISPSLQFYDTGLRRGGSTINEVIAGPSAGAGLLRLSDGSYQTSDGRLTAATGNAMVIRDGKTYTCDARWEVEGEDERLWVENYYRNEGFLFEVPKNSLMEGDVLQIPELIRERYYVTEKDRLDSYNWHTPFFALAHDGIWKGPQLNDSTYEALTVRVMYYQEGGEAVYYVYAKLKNAQPAEVEALCVVNMAAGNDGNFSDAARIKVGETVELTYSGEVYGASYNVYEWEITDGAGNVYIDSVGDRCQVTALSKGVATVTVRYRYGVTEPDVLTGNPTTAAKSKSQSYNFIIE